MEVPLTSNYLALRRGLRIFIPSYGPDLLEDLCMTLEYFAHELMILQPVHVYTAASVGHELHSSQICFTVWIKTVKVEYVVLT